MSSEQLVAYAAKRKRSRRIKGVLIALVTAATLVVGAAGAYYLWFMSSLNGALGGDDQASQVLSKRIGDEPFYMLLLASDSRRDEHKPNAGQQTDVMILMRVDAKNHTFTMLSIPRDTRYVQEDGSVVKMNALYNIGGVSKAIEGVSKLTGVPISHYAMVYMSDCKSIVDDLGGVEIDVPIEINNNDPETEENVNIQPGLQMLDGRQAQAFAISRHEATSGSQDAYRQSKIRTLIEAIVSKVIDRPAFEIPGTVISLAGYVETDMSAEELVDLAVEFATGSGGVKIYQASGPSEGGLDEEVGLWLCYENPEGWAEVVSVMDSGGDPSTVTYD